MLSPKKTLLKALQTGGKILRSSLGRTRYRYKSPMNLVTRADHSSEEAVCTILRRRFPDHSILAEESGESGKGSPYTWVVDPLDGTTNFAHGFPVACISIGLVHYSTPVLGGVYDPFRDELFWAEKGKGSYLNGKKIHVSKTQRLDESLLLTGFPYDRTRRSGFYVNFYRQFMERCHDVRRSGAAALDLCWAACGRVDGFWEFKLRPWDVAAGKLIVEEAGGRVSDFSDREWKALSAFGGETLATNGRIHSEMLKILRNGRSWISGGSFLDRQKEPRRNPERISPLSIRTRR